MDSDSDELYQSYSDDDYSEENYLSQDDDSQTHNDCQSSTVNKPAYETLLVKNQVAEDHENTSQLWQNKNDKNDDGPLTFAEMNSQNSQNTNEIAKKINQVVEKRRQDIKCVIEKCQEEINVLANYGISLPKIQCLLLLNKFSWDKDNLSERYWEDCDRILADYGLQYSAEEFEDGDLEISKNSMETCQICFEEVPTTNMKPAKILCCPKTNNFCSDCLQSYIKINIPESSDINLKCLNASCKLQLNPDKVLNYLNDNSEKMPKAVNLYHKKLVNLVVEANPQTIWCCQPSCEAIIWYNNRTEAKKFRNYYYNTEVFRKQMEEEQENREELETESKIENVSKSLTNFMVSLGKKSRKSSGKQNSISTENTSSSSSKSPPAAPIKRKIVEKIFNPEKLSVTCDLCLTEQCFNCNRYWHDPISCEYLTKWEKKCADDSETELWITVNTRPCPKCGVNIEKNSGCNHMTCKNASCRYDFCWICMGDWKAHGNSWYQCNMKKPKSKDGTGERSTQEELEKKSEEDRKLAKQYLDKYEHCFGRYSIHAASLKLEMDLKISMVKKQEYLQDYLNISYTETRFLEQAFNVLCLCRRTIMYCYIFQYYLVPNEEKDGGALVNIHQIFIDNLNDLYVRIENLSKILENWNPNAGMGMTTFDVELMKKYDNYGFKTKTKETKPSKNTFWQHSQGIPQNSQKNVINETETTSTSKNSESKQKSDSFDLSEQIAEFHTKRQTIMNSMNVCANRREKLLEQVAEGYQRNYWCFFEHG